MHTQIASKESDAFPGPTTSPFERMPDQLFMLHESGEEPTDWVSSLAYSRKANGKLRICLDPKDLNAAIKRDHYKTPTVEEITHKLAGSRKFTKLDGTSSYLCIILDYESSLLTTFNMPWGRYRFIRLPFGLACSQDIFQ